VVVVAVVWAYRHFRVEENREQAARWIDRQLDRPGLRPLGKYIIYPVARFLRGPLLFFWNRITPGDLGLELTTQLAVAAVGSFAYAANAIGLRDRSSQPGDATAFRWADDIRSDWLDHLARALTHLGSLAVVSGATVVTVVVLLMRRRIIESVTLVGGLAITYVAVHIAKDAVDRPRPSNPLVETAGQSYPSAHAAYAFAWIAIAVVLTRTLPGLARTTAVIVAAVVLAAAIGLTRIYLRAHYLSDVVGGWGMGACVFSLCGMAGLIVAFVRHNGHRT
jgi:membrane-associated phospholipid phosphatase